MSLFDRVVAEAVLVATIILFLCNFIFGCYLFRSCSAMGPGEFQSMNVQVLTLCLVLGLSNLVAADDWPQFLGPGGSAVSAEQVPDQWDSRHNLVWKSDLPGAGSSSPIIVGQRVLVTCYSQAGDALTRFVVCLDKASGKTLWSKAFPATYREDAYRGYIQEHGYASNTPASDGQHLYVFFGKGGVHALDLEGNILWSVDVGRESSSRQWGSASSLLLYQDMVIVNAAEESQAIIALDKATGKERWRQEAAMLELTYGTPRLVTSEGGNTEVVISVPGEIWGLSPENGELNWFASTPMTGNVSPSVVVEDGTLYSFGGYRSSGSISVRAGGDGDVSRSHVNWTGRATSYVATPLLHAGRFYWIDDRGLANCIQASNGEVVYRQRVSGLTGRPVYASPVMIGGKIYVVTRRGGTIVYPPGETFGPIAVNKIEGDDSDFNASPAVADSRLYLRSNQALYCIGE